jgi:hypothetical protein
VRPIKGRHGNVLKSIVTLQLDRGEPTFLPRTLPRTAFRGEVSH